MAASFDPYHRWLGISPKDQPPNAYRLLGVDLFEPDAEVIEQAADQRMTHLRGLATGPNGQLTQRLLNEVSAARVCLLNPERRAVYDDKLRQRLQAAAAVVQFSGDQSSGARASEPPTVETTEIEPAFDDILGGGDRAAAALLKRTAQKRPAPVGRIVAVVLAVVAAFATAYAIVYRMHEDAAPARPEAVVAQSQDPAKPAGDPQPPHPAAVANVATAASPTPAAVRPARNRPVDPQATPHPNASPDLTQPSPPLGGTPPNADGQAATAAQEPRRFDCQISPSSRGLWSLDGGELLVASEEQPISQGVAHNFAQIYFGDADADDVDFSLEAMTSDPNAELVLGGRRKIDGQGYQFAVGRNGGSLITVTRDAGLTRLCTLGRSPIGAGPAAWHEYHLRLRGPNVDCYCDGEKLIYAFDEQLPSGQLSVQALGRYRIRNLVVRRLGGLVLLQGLPNLESASLPMRTAAAAVAPRPTLRLHPLLPTSEDSPQTWQYSNAVTTDRWFADDQDGSVWQPGPAPFGASTTGGPTIGSEWRGGNFWLRRNFTLATVPDHVFLRVFNREPVEIYINGVLANKLTQPLDNYTIAGISDEAKAAMHPGANKLAVRCSSGAAPLIDVGLSSGERQADGAESNGERVPRDLLPAIDVARDPLMGRLQRADGGLALSGETILPLVSAAPPASYGVKLIVERDDCELRAAQFDIGLVAGNHHSVAVLDGLQNTASGLAVLDGRPLPNNPSCVRGANVLGPQNEHAIVCNVRPAAITVTVDGRSIVNAHYDFARQSAPRRFAALDKSHLFLHTTGAEWRIKSIVLLAPAAAAAPPLAQSEPNSEPAPATATPNDRLAWIGHKGRFDAMQKSDDAETLWKASVAVGNQTEFKEVNRTAEYVEMESASRAVKLRLSSVHCEIWRKDKDAYEVRDQGAWGVPKSAAADATRPVVAIDHHPPLAVAPFNQAVASARQKAWARYLKTAVQTANEVGMKLVLIPPGQFTMGSPESEGRRLLNETQHRVRITKPFYVAAAPVTKGQFARFVAGAGYKTDAENDPNGSWGYAADGTSSRDQINWRTPGMFGFTQPDDHPVVFVSWNDALAFCDWLSNKEGKRYRLPTEAEWEYACRAGTVAALYFGEVADGNLENTRGDLPYGANVRGVFLKHTSMPGAYPANAWGLFDMHGNVQQWCQDWHDDGYYSTSPADDPQGPAKGTMRSVRGGSWLSQACNCRSAFRGHYSPIARYVDVGFRVVREVTDDSKPASAARATSPNPAAASSQPRAAGGAAPHDADSSSTSAPKSADRPNRGVAKTREEAVEKLKQLGGKFEVRGSHGSWSPDGARLVFAANASGRGQLGMLERATGKVSGLGVSGVDPAWSPAPGNWIAYAVDDARRQIWCARPDGKETHHVGDGQWPCWAADGRTLYYVDDARSRLMSVIADAPAAEPKVVFENVWSFSTASPDGKYVGVRRADVVQVIEIASHKVVRSWPVSGWKWWCGNWSPDGKTFGFSGCGDLTPADATGVWLE